MKRAKHTLKCKRIYHTQLQQETKILWAVYMLRNKWSEANSNWLPAVQHSIKFNARWLMDRDIFLYIRFSFRSCCTQDLAHSIPGWSLKSFFRFFLFVGCFWAKTIFWDLYISSWDVEWWLYTNTHGFIQQQNKQYEKKNNNKRLNAVLSAIDVVILFFCLPLFLSLMILFLFCVTLGTWYDIQQAFDDD